MLSWLKRHAKTTRPTCPRAASLRVEGFLLDECVVGLAKYLTELIDLPVEPIPHDARGEKDEFVHGLAYGREYAIITADSGKNDGSGFCTLNGVEVTRHGVILLPHDSIETQLNVLRKFDAEIALYLVIPDRANFYLSLRGEQAELFEWGVGLKTPKIRNLQTGDQKSLQSFDGIRCRLTTDGLEIIEGSESKINVLAFNAGRTLAGKEKEVSITTNALDSDNLPKALDYIAKLAGSVYLIKSCFGGAIEVREGKRSLMKFQPQPGPGYNL